MNESPFDFIRHLDRIASCVVCRHPYFAKVVSAGHLKPACHNGCFTLPIEAAYEARYRVVTEQPFAKASPIRCSICNTQLTSFISGWSPDRRFVQSQVNDNAVCEKCIEDGRQRLLEASDPTPTDESKYAQQMADLTASDGRNTHVTFWYYKESGKYYSNGEYAVPFTRDNPEGDWRPRHFYHIVSMLKEMLDRGERPGLIDGFGFNVLVTVYTEFGPLTWLYVRGPDRNAIAPLSEDR